MTIQEAIRSAKPFGRKKWEDLKRDVKLRVGKGHHEFLLTHEEGYHQFLLTPEDILADDWEVEEEKIEITKSQLMIAIAEICREESTSIMKSRYGPTWMEFLEIHYAKLLKKLGFKD